VDLHLCPPTALAKSAMHDYAEAILSGQPHPAGGDQGLVVMQILDALYESARTGAPVKIG
jgi:predicted dehydrogenase